ncbi:MAG TPA: hypothetical protein EYG03_12130 [Planctomycetes bacterium]|nr:hypothetical protein [Planctomycetota bacterium]
MSNSQDENGETAPDEPQDSETQETLPEDAQVSEGGAEASMGNDASTDSTETGAADPPGQTPDFDDELPEEEELTPELVEEEAIRGDFMLRWAAIFLAVLFGFSQMVDTQTLVHIRSGDQMLQNGFLPSPQDSLSYSLDGQSVATSAWAFDNLVSYVYSVGGPHGLTVFKALLAGILAYLLSLISVRGMPTWWSSICCVLAVAACSIDFQPVTDLVTLVGMVVILLQLHRYHEGSAAGLHWKLPLLVAVWANFDSHAYVGVFAVVLFAVGLQVRKVLSERAGEAPGASPSPLWKVAGLSVLALLVTPAPIASLTSVITTYTVEYPSMAALKPLTDSGGNPLAASVLLDGRTEYFPLWVPEVLEGFEFAYVTGLAMLLIAVVVLVIARNREDVPWVVTLTGFFVAALFAVHELPAAALVAAVAAGTSAQRWYGRTFRQEYTIDPKEVLFSRGGRAVTVFAMAFLAFFTVADRLPTRSPVGLGFEADLKTTMDTLGQQLAELPEDARVFHTRMNQGDLLIWHGYQSFIDSRVLLFGSYTNRESSIYRFDSLRRSLLKTPDQEPPLGTSLDAASVGEGDPAREDGLVNLQWNEEYDALGLTHVMVRLSPPGDPAYQTTNAFVQSPNWILTQRGPSAAFFQKAAADVIPVDLQKLVFSSSETADVERFDFARENDFYSKYIYASRRTLSGPLREAQHAFVLNSQISPQVVYDLAVAHVNAPDNASYTTALGVALAGPLLTIRNCNASLFEDPQNFDAYGLLGLAYVRLDAFEQAIVGAVGGNSADSLRYMQAVMALRQALVLEPEAAELWNALMELYGGRGRIGLALECVEEVLTLEEDRLLQDPNSEERLRQLYETRRTWQEQTETIQQAVDEMLEQQPPEDLQQHASQKLTVIEQLHEGGHVRLALNLANDNIDLLRAIPRAELLRGQMLLETGGLEDGFEVLNRLVAIVRENQQRAEFAGLQWHTPVALSQLAKGAYPSAIDAWRDKLDVFTQLVSNPQIGRSLLQTLPLVPAVEARIGAPLPGWPLSHLIGSQVPLTTLPRGQVESRFMMAMAGIESGSIANARFLLKGLISNGGENTFRPLAEIYLRQVSDDAASLIADANVDLWEDYEFPEAAPSAVTPGVQQPATEDVKAGPDGSTAEPSAGKPLPDNTQDSDKPEAASVPEQKTPAEQ